MARPPRQTDTPRVSSRIDRSSMLTPNTLQRTVSEVQVAAKDEQERLSRPLELVDLPWYRRRLTAVVFVLLTAAVWGTQLLLWRRPEPVLATRDRDAVLRYAMAQQVARIEEFRAANRRLPRALTELAEVYRGMSYVPLDTLRYRLTGTDDQLVINFRSDSSMNGFLGGSLLTIRERRK
jgi:hypothetical protein